MNHAARHNLQNCRPDLSILGDESTQSLRLIVLNDIQRLEEAEGRPSRYVALSYCWGKKEDLDQAPSLTTTSNNFASHIKAIPTDRLSKTIQDAITLTRKLGLHYLRADSLCIIQGSNEEATDDWAKESSTMASIYGGAYLTIAAAWGDSVHSGLFTKRPSKVSSSPFLGLKSLQDPTCHGSIQLTQ
jgi:hypothetical protein